MKCDERPKLLPLWQAIADVPQSCWLTRQPTKPISEESSMTDSADTALPGAHSAWMEHLLLIQEGPPPSPEIFNGDPKQEQLEAVRVIGARLRESRELNNLSQTLAARRLGYSNSSKLSKIEGATDTYSVPLWLIIRAAKVYGVSIDFLFGVCDDWEGSGAIRSTNTWVLEAWERMRQRDLSVLDQVHCEVVEVAEHTTALIRNAEEVVQAISDYRARHPSFDETPMSGTVVGRAERLAQHAQEADKALRRYRLTPMSGRAQGANNGK